ncbi:MAG: trypsin-like peptidase domain-containing protein [Nitrospirota bacterium]|nr:trypsin-like peptidase domain-containing protein [Nitrospirota bacterium]
MPFSIRPCCRFPVQSFAAYNDGPFLNQPPAYFWGLGSPVRRLGLKLLLLLIIYSCFVVGAHAQSIAEIAETVGNSVAMIITYDVTGSPTAQGSGVFITETGIILTNAHVVENAYSAEVISSLGTFDKVRILTRDSKRDLALIAIPTDKSSPPSFAKDTNFKPGERVIAIGNPLGLERTISDGLISGIRHKGDGVELIQTTVPISHGSSGGVLLNTSGELIGITSSSFEGGQNINFAISLNTIYAFIEGYQNDDPQGVKHQELRLAKESVWYRIVLKWIGYIVFGVFALVFSDRFGWALPLIFVTFYLLYLAFKGIHWLITYPFRRFKQRPQAISSDGNDKLG